MSQTNSVTSLSNFDPVYLYSIHGDQYSTFEQHCDTVAQLRSLVGKPGMQVFVRGLVIAGDGGAGPFWWNATSTLADDGQNVIVPSSPFQQPGAWLRLLISGANGAVFKTISALMSFPIAPAGIIFSGTLGSTATVQGFNTPGDHGGGVFDLIATSRTADNVVAFSVSGQSGFKWIRRYDLGALTFEMAGAVGDYSFVTDTGTDNAAAFNAFFSAFGQSAYNAGNIGNSGIRVHLRPGASYLLQSITTLCRYVHITGTGYNRSHYLATNFPQWLNAGSAIVLDVTNGATYFAPIADTHLENFAILRRGLPINPTGAQCIGFYGTSGGTWNDGSFGVRCDGAGAPAPSNNGARIRLERLTIIGFGTAVIAKATNTDIIDCIFDCYNGPEFADIGDVVHHHNCKNLPIMGIAVPSGDPNASTCRAHAGIGLNAHDRVDTFDSVGFESENWAIGAQFGNLSTAPHLRNFAIECNGNAGDIGISFINWIQGLQISDGYIGTTGTPLSVNAVQWDFATKASWFNEGAAGETSSLSISGLNLVATSLAAGPVIYIGGDQCHTDIRDCRVYPNGADLLHVAALVAGRSGTPQIKIADLTLEQNSNGVITIDPTMAANVFLDRILNANGKAGQWIIPPPQPSMALQDGRFYGSRGITDTAVQSTISITSLIACAPIYIPNSATLRVLNCQTAGTITGTLHARMALYTDAGGLPGVPVAGADSGDLTQTTSGSLSSAALNIAIPPGWYWPVFETSGLAGATIYSITGSTPNSGTQSGTATPGALIINAFNTLLMTHTYGAALPTWATTSEGVASYMPVIAMKL